MADNKKLELVVEVDVNANASIKSVNTGLYSMARRVARVRTMGLFVDPKRQRERS
jgi:hypothetical protein